jgi:hypothetical protein
MSMVGSTTTMTASVGAARTAIQISVPIIDQSQGSPGDAALEAAVRRVSALLYMRSHLTSPPDVTDMGGGMFNVLV